MILKEGTLLQGGKYKIVRHIASGGFGNTYEALDTSMGNARVAIKEFFVKDCCARDSVTQNVTLAVESKRDLVAKLKVKFLTEAEAIRRMKHNNIVRVYSSFEENDTAYYVMEYIDGVSLEQYGKLDEATALKYIRQIADALKYVHSQNCLHLDIKPANILINKDDKAILIDFGSSKYYDDGKTVTTTTMPGLYTPGYAPYEQTVGGITGFTPASDIYALGATLYRLLSGNTPPPSGTRLEDDVPLPLPYSISESTRKAVENAMIPQKKTRTQTVDDFLENLDAKTIYGPIPQPPTPPTPPPPGPTPTGSNPFGKILIGVVGVIFLIIGAIYMHNVYVEYQQRQEALRREMELTRLQEEKQQISSQTFTVNGVSFEMMKVEGGTFVMGTDRKPGDFMPDYKDTAHEVTLSNFMIGRTEVTQELWIEIMGNNPSLKFKGNNRPVQCIDWYDCQEFIRRLNNVTGKNFRLPTEAEWEFAARGGKNSEGYEYSGSNDIEKVAWYCGNSYDCPGGESSSDFGVHIVATKAQNEIGIFDMTGNVAEWCQDWVGDYNIEAQINPSGPSNGTHRVYRGGSWLDNSPLISTKDRGTYQDPSFKWTWLGLRLALTEE